MEYILGAIVAIVAGIVTYLSVERAASLKSVVKVGTSQSRHFELMVPFIDNILNSYNAKTIRFIDTQASKHMESNSIKIIFHEDKAYWIDNNIFYTANLVAGNIDLESTKIVDTMTMTNVELKQLSSIVEMLTGGNHDRSNPRN